MEANVFIFCPECARISGRCFRHSVTVEPTFAFVTLPTGWRCPCCQAIHAPSVLQCPSCGPLCNLFGHTQVAVVQPSCPAPTAAGSCGCGACPSTSPWG